MAKKFTGSWVIFIILLIICWPAALVYFYIKYVEQQTFAPNYGAPPQPYQAPPQQSAGFCQKCGAALEPGAQFCQKCGNRQQ
jgi:hypothetical protein